MTNALRPITDWLPITQKEVDHPAFGTAVVGRMLENQSLRVAIAPKPNWRDE